MKRFSRFEIHRRHERWRVSRLLHDKGYSSLAIPEESGPSRPVLLAIQILLRNPCPSRTATWLVDEGGNARTRDTFVGIIGISRRNDGGARESPSTVDVFPTRRTTDKSVHSTRALFNKNSRTSFERSSLRYNDSYVPIGRTCGGDDAASRFPLAVANGTANGCSRGGQSRAISTTNDAPCREFFRLFSNLGNCESPSYRLAIADRADRYYVDIARY